MGGGGRSLAHQPSTACSLTFAMELVADLEESDRRWTGLVDGFGGAESEMEQALMEDASGRKRLLGR